MVKLHFGFISTRAEQSLDDKTTSEKKKITYYPKTFKLHTKPANCLPPCAPRALHTPLNQRVAQLKHLNPRFINAYHARALDKKRAKLTQPQRSCPRAKSVASYFFTSSFIRINRLECCGSPDILPLQNDAKTWWVDTQKSLEHIFENNALQGIQVKRAEKCWQGYVKREWGAQRGSWRVSRWLRSTSSLHCRFTLLSGDVTDSRPLPTNIQVLARAAKYSGLPRAERAQHPKHSRRIESSEFSYK